MANPCFGTELKFSTSITLASLYGVVALPAILGNVVFLWVIYKARTIRTFSNLLLSSLATADLLVGLLIDPLWIARCVLPRRPYHNPFKIAIDSLWIQTSVTTTFSLCIVSLDRYIAVRSALLYNQIVTTRRCCMAVVFVWLASLAFGLSRIFVTNPANLPALWMCVTVVTILIPMVVIIFCYYRILDVAKKKICNNCEAQRPARRRARHRGSSEPKDSYHGRLCRSVVYHLVATKSSYVLYPFDNE